MRKNDKVRKHSFYHEWMKIKSNRDTVTSITFSSYKTSALISFFKKNLWTIWSHASSKDLSKVNSLMEVPVTQVRFWPSYFRLRYNPCTSCGWKFSSCCFSNLSIFASDSPNTKRKLRGVFLPLIKENAYSLISFHKE